MAPTDIQSEQLYVHESRIRGQVVLITNVDFTGGIAELAFELAKRGAKVVVGTSSIPNYRGEDPDDMEMPYYKHCNVNDWDSQVSLFQSAESEYGGVDIVMAFSDVEYICDFITIPVDENGLPTKPDVEEIQSNLISVIYTTRLAIHYLNKSSNPNSLKRIIFRGAPNSLAGLDSSRYGADKHGLLGFIRALQDDVQTGGIRVSAVAWTDSQERNGRSLSIGAEPVSLFIGGVFLAATDRDPEANGAIYGILNDPHAAAAGQNHIGIVRRTAYLPFTEGTNEPLVKRAKTSISARA